MSLVAGLPISFIYSFYRPIFIQRPIIHPPKILSARPTDIEDGLDVDEFDDYGAEAEEVMPTPTPMRELRARPKKRGKLGRPPGKPAATTGGMVRDISDEAFLDKMISQTKTQTKDLG